MRFEEFHSRPSFAFPFSGRQSRPVSGKSCAEMRKTILIRPLEQLPDPKMRTVLTLLTPSHLGRNVGLGNT